MHFSQTIIFYIMLSYKFSSNRRFNLSMFPVPNLCLFSYSSLPSFHSQNAPSPFKSCPIFRTNLNSFLFRVLMTYFSSFHSGFISVSLWDWYMWQEFREHHVSLICLIYEWFDLVETNLSCSDPYSFVHTRTTFLPSPQGVLTCRLTDATFCHLCRVLLLLL